MLSPGMPTLLRTVTRRPDLAVNGSTTVPRLTARHKPPLLYVHGYVKPKRQGRSATLSNQRRRTCSLHAPQGNEYPSLAEVRAHWHDQLPRRITDRHDLGPGAGQGHLV